MSPDSKEKEKQHRADTNKLTNNFGAPVPDNEHSLSAGERGPLLLQDYFLVEKLAHFDRERIPERVVEAPRQARRSAPTRPAAQAPVVVQAAPAKPDSLTVTIFRGTDRQQQKFESPKTAPQN